MTARKPIRVIIWGPGHVGGGVLRATLTDDRFQVVGVRVFSPGKVGKDIGTLVGLDPVGVAATDSVAEILALDADCVVYCPRTTVMFEGQWSEVDRILRSGKNVVSSNSHHNMARTTWLSTSQSPTDVIRRLVEIDKGPIPVPNWKTIRAGLRALTGTPGLSRITNPLLDRWLEPIFDAKVLPRQLTGEQVVRTCREAGVSVRGAGPHPDYMAEHLGMALAHLLDRPRNFRIAETFDYAAAYSPDMWGGLELLGMGQPLDALDSRHALVLGGDIAYGDVVANVAYSMRGIHGDDLRIEGDAVGLPSNLDVEIGDEFVKKGTIGVMGLIHKAFYGEELVGTNEEWWFLGPENAYYGPNLPFGRSAGLGTHTFGIEAARVRIDMQVAAFAQPDAEAWDVPMDLTRTVILESIEPTVASEPGVVVYDERPHYLSDDGSFVVSEAGDEPLRIVVLGDGATADTVHALANRRPGLEIVARTQDAPDCAVVVGAAASDQVSRLLAAGIPVVTDRYPRHPVATTTAPLYVAGAAADVIIDRIVPILARAIDGKRHVRFVDALDASTEESIDIGLGGAPESVDAAEVFARIDAVSGAAVPLRLAATLGIDAAAVSFDYELSVTTAGRAEKVGPIVLEPGTVAAVHAVRRGYLADQVVFVHEVCRYAGPNYATRGSDLPMGGFTGPQCYTIESEGVRAISRVQLQVSPVEDNADTAAELVATALLDAIPAVSAASPGVLKFDPSPHFRLDRRLS
ncbi:hypothetical protein ACFXHA_10790 [Nocardia sp. NPDC059240]|uniref:hypothetical protein n=1 Tax=Nocardia sp. NPDC059240 TaxID=3346786 RepID=UPI00367BCFF0